MSTGGRAKNAHPNPTLTLPPTAALGKSLPPCVSAPLQRADGNTNSPEKGLLPLLLWREQCRGSLELFGSPPSPTRLHLKCPLCWDHTHHCVAVTLQGKGGQWNQTLPALLTDTPKFAFFQLADSCSLPVFPSNQFHQTQREILNSFLQDKLFNQPPIIQFGYKLKLWLAFHATFSAFLLV